MYRAIQYQVIHIFPSRRTLCCINHATWKTIRLHAELDTDFFTYFTLQWRNNAYLLVTNEPRGRVQCMSKIPYTDDISLGENTNRTKMCFRWGQDYNCSWESLLSSSEGTCGDWSMKNSSHRVHVLWMKDESPCSSCQIIWLRVQMMKQLNQQNSELQIKPKHKHAYLELSLYVVHCINQKKYILWFKLKLLIHLIIRTTRPKREYNNV